MVTVLCMTLRARDVGLKNKMRYQRNKKFKDLMYDLGVNIKSSKEQQKTLEKLLTTLMSREEKVIRYRYCIGESKSYTLREIGKLFHVTGEIIRMLEARALRKLGHPRRRKLLECSIKM